MKTIADHTMLNSKNRLSPLLTLAVALVCTSLAQAAPVGGVVAAGSASISSAGSNTTITQSTPKAIINWQGFNVGAGESVRFNQPSASSVILNRVIGPDGSSIMGNISANGRVFLINPNGILFGSGSQVNVGGMVASTLGISDANFISGNYRFMGDSAAALLNQGILNTNTDGGYIALLGANVSNNGVITARLGTVALAAGNGITLDVAGDHLLNVSVDQGAINALVSNGHLIMADGGQVLMTARGASNLLSNAVNNTGLIQAQSIESANGLIILSAGPDAGVVNVSGTLDASGARVGQTGGAVQVLGGTVNLTGATINVSGNAGGGEALVGGNFNGAGPQANSLFTNIDAPSTINADALQTGNGGKIAVWSDNTTVMGGTLTARGGVLSGDGGFIETSGKYLSITDSAYVNTLATQGKTGMWLLDPLDFTIASSGGDMTGLQVSNALNSTSMAYTNMSGTSGTSGSIYVNDVISWSSSSSLTLTAANNVNITQAITNAGSGPINITATNGNIDSTAAISSLGNITLSAAHGHAKIGTATATTGSIAVTAGTSAEIAAATVTTGNVVINAGTSASIVTGTVTTGNINITAGTDASITTATITSGNLSITGGNDASVTTATITAGRLDMIAGNDGSGVGRANITGSITGAPVAKIRFNPTSYINTTPEINAYQAKIGLATVSDIKAWAILQGIDKTYNQSTVATLSLKTVPTGVTLNSGTASFGNKSAGVDKTVTYSGYSITDTTNNYILYSSAGTPGAGTTKATISPASLVVSATGTNKVFDGTTTDVVTLSATPLSGDSVLPGTYTSANFSNMAVGTDKPVSVVGIALTGADAGNYSYNTTASTMASITPSSTPPTPSSNVNGLVIVPVVPPSSSSQAPIALQEEIHNGVSILPITPIIGAGMASGSLIALQAKNQSNILLVADPQKGAELQSLFPAPVIAPYRIPKQGRN